MTGIALLLACCLGTAIGACTSTCRELRAERPTAPSGVYEFESRVSDNKYQAYCEMGLNGGAYTFLSPQALTVLTNAELQGMITDRTSVLLRIRGCDGSQKYSVLQQLPQYKSISLFIGLSNHVGYNAPVNAAVLGTPYLYIGFLPVQSANNNNVQGLRSNGKSLTFSNGDKNPNSYLALFPNFRETPPSVYALTTTWPLCDNLLVGTPLRNPSTRVMPPDWFMFLETHFGGGGCYTQTDSRLVSKCVLGATIGFR